MLSNKVKTLRLQFKNEIALWEIPLFRGCVIHSMDNANLLFHNHDGDDKLRYSYPLIQYKRIGGKAAIVCVGEGTEAIGEFFQSGNFAFQIGERKLDMSIESVKANITQVQFWDDNFLYGISKWLPLSSENFRTFNSLEGIIEQTEFLQNILIGNIISFCKGMNITLDKQIVCKIINLKNLGSRKHKGVNMISFNADFACNISLPEYIGLGKGVSLGFGNIFKLKNR